MKEIRKQEKRKLILNTAINIFSDRGLHSTRISDIAKSAGIAHGLIYHYFKDKDDILVSIFEENWSQILDETKELLKTKKNAFEKIETVIDYFFHLYIEKPQLFKVLVIHMRQTTVFAENYDLAALRSYFDFIESIIQEGVARGTIRRDLDSKILVHVLFGSVENVLRGWVLKTLVDSSDNDRDQAKKMILSIIKDGTKNKKKNVK